MPKLLSDRDAAKLGKMFKWFDRQTANRSQFRRQHKNRGGGGGGGNRKAYASVAAGASGTIACYLDTDGEGDTVNVVCEVAGGTNLNAALPRLADGTMITVWNDNGTWRSTMTFQASGDC